SKNRRIRPSQRKAIPDYQEITKQLRQNSIEKFLKNFFGVKVGFSRFRTVRVDRKWLSAEVMKKDRQLVEAAGLDITPNRGIL
ncbi:MAG: hypothetical protein ACI31D_03485, partial [Candidatus Limisoma sp.]